jgi:Tfp pilus assembly protein PilZ
MISGTERLLEARRAVPANRQKSIGEAEALLLTNASQSSRTAIVTAVVMLSPVNFDSSAASRRASQFTIDLTRRARNLLLRKKLAT